jgi:hypothetical protein
MTADMLQREGLEPVKYASNDRVIISYELGVIWKKVTKYIGRKARVFVSSQVFTKYFYVIWSDLILISHRYRHRFSGKCHFLSDRTK